MKLIVALSADYVIGYKGKIPWKIPSDMLHFKHHTQHNIVIMGRKTFESFGNRPLPNRINIVISRNTNLVVPQGVYLVNSIDLAKNIAESLAEDNQKQIYVIGGSQIYKEFHERGYINEVIMSCINTFFYDSSKNKDDFDFLCDSLTRDNKNLPYYQSTVHCANDQFTYLIIKYKVKNEKM